MRRASVLAVAWSATGRTWEYVSRVMPTLAWPSRSEMTLTSCQPCAAARAAVA